MKEVLDYIDERKAEFDRHLFVARLLEDRVDDEVLPEEGRVEVRHINTLKSGLLIHLYNIVEAVSTRTLVVVGQTIITEKPRLWTADVMKEWLRAVIWDGEDRIGEGVVKRLMGVSGVLASGGAPDAFMVKGEPGSWDDAAIKNVAKRMGCSLNVPRAILREASEPVYLNEMSAMKYLSSRRNAIAHGATTFEDGARDQTLAEISDLANRVLPFLRAVSTSYQTFLDTKAYLAPQEIAA